MQLPPLTSQRLQRYAKLIGSVPLQAPVVALRTELDVSGHPETTGADEFAGAVAGPLRGGRVPETPPALPEMLVGVLVDPPAAPPEVPPTVGAGAGSVGLLPAVAGVDVTLGTTGAFTTIIDEEALALPTRFLAVTRT